MRLDEALHQIAATTGLDAVTLNTFAAEDAVGGRDTGAWSAMSTFAAEGQILYALVRLLRPTRCVEIGVASGGTSTHLLSALAANGAGELWSCDIEPNVGQNVPEALRDRWTLITGNALTVELPTPADFVFEDGAHSYEFTSQILPRLKALNPRMIISHDYYSHEVYSGFGVKQAWDEALPGALGIKIDGAFTGLGVWVNPDWKAPEPPHPELVKPPKKGARRG